ncbi:hypothetical protein CRYUN_Cryun23aG0031400 [Craigia yunnanensis]
MDASNFNHHTTSPHLREDLSRVGHQQRQLQLEDDELARAISLSLKVFTSFLCLHDLISLCLLVLVLSNINSVQTADEEKAVHMMKDHYEQMGTYDPSARTKATTNNSSKWGDISLEELDEAIMLETQVTLLFSQIPGGPSYRLSHRSHEQSGPGRSIPQAISRPQSSFLMDQRL